MPCSVAGQTQPSSILHLPESAGPPHARSNVPAASNSMTDGAGTQQSPRTPYGRGNPITSTGFPSLSLCVGSVSAASSLVSVRHIEAAHLSDDPVIRQFLRPARVGDEARCLRRGRNGVDAGALGEPLQN